MQDGQRFVGFHSSVDDATTFLVGPVVVDVAFVIFLLARAITDKGFTHVRFPCQTRHVSLAAGVFRLVPQHARRLKRPSGFPLFEVGGGALRAREQEEVEGYEYIKLLSTYKNL